MCVVSNISDWGGQTYPDWTKPFIPNETLPQIPFPYDPVKKEAEKMQEFLELIKQAKKFDKAAGQPDCEDPKKAEFIEAVERRLAAIEKTLKKLTAGQRIVKSVRKERVRLKKKAGKRR